MSQNVFAYGSNMCSGRFRAYHLRPEGAGRGALLTGYRLLFNKASTDRSGKANVEAHEGSETWGVLYEISDADLRTLDDGEVGYRRLKLPVLATDNVESHAWVYVAVTTNSDAALRPYTWYKRFLVEGAREHGLPAEYITNLELIDAVQDANEVRNRRKRALPCHAQS
jgi:gamma-glutamylcyclotransferase